MAKGKKHRKGSASTAAGALGTGAVAGAATYLAGAVVKAITKEAVQRGADRLLKHGGGGKAKRALAANGADLGLIILRTLAEADTPVPVAKLALLTEAGLLPCLEAVQLLRRARMVKLGDGRRTAELTPVGREALETFSAEGDDEEVGETLNGADTREEAVEREAPPSPEPPPRETGDGTPAVD